MFKMVSCNDTVYYGLLALKNRWFIRWFVVERGEWSQTNIFIFGIAMAYTQPNTIGKPGDPDFFGCRRFLRVFFKR